MLRFLAAVFALICAALTAVSLGFTEVGHYNVTFTVGSSEFETILGLLKTCSVSGGTTSCDWIKAEDVTVGSCSRSGTTYGARFISATTLMFLGGFTSLVAMPLAAVHTRKGAVIMTTLLALAFLSVLVAGGLFYMSVFWLFCDAANVCDFYTGTAVGATSCTEKPTLYAWLGVGAVGSALLGFCFGVGAIATAPPPVTDDVPEDADGAPEHAGPKSDDNAAPDETADADPDGTANRSGAQEAEAAEPAAAEEAGETSEDDWVWDEESQMYWSDASQLYLHWESGMFYDPSSGWWYDPASEKWFEAE